jgi:hypothetical protein
VGSILIYAGKPLTWLLKKNNMEQESRSNLAEFEAATNPSGNSAINVLTILTFIGCAIQLLFVFLTKWLMSFAVKVANDPSLMEKMSEKERAQIMDSQKMYDLYTQYQIPLVVASLLGIALCFWGALQMRKMKKQGFYLYVVGEFAPLIVSGLLLGFAANLSSIPAILISFVIPVVFTVLYALQLKHMK